VKSKDIGSFDLLKKKIAEQMMKSFPGINPSISEWKGQEIVDFQEELLQKVNAHISEKWFYSHIKSSKDTLPRIDMLNLLSKYAGYVNWDDFKFRNVVHETQPPANYSKKANRFFIYVPLLVLAILAIMFFLFKMVSTKDYRFRFYDADTREPVTNTIIEVNLLKEGESPVSYLCGPDGSFILKTDRLNVRFVVKSPYYQTDTIVRILDKFNPDEIVQLRPNNYAMMIQYFSTMNVKDWQKRRDQLNLMIADSAMIYQVFDKEAVGVELFNKWEFINKLTLPTTGLKDIEILDTKYQGDKMILIRFKQKEEAK
jgi:hypothetical protein